MARRTGVVLMALLALVAGQLALLAGVPPIAGSDGGGPSWASITDGGVVSPDAGGRASSSQPSLTAFLVVELREIAWAFGHVFPGIPDIPMAYPVEEEPDGNRWLPHHGLWPLPLYVMGWYFWHPGGAPVIGATLVGLAVLLLLDDWLSHAMGIRTPGDIAFDWLMSRQSFRRVYLRFWWMVYR